MTKERKAKIENLYRTILRRSPDKTGLDFYCDSDLSIEDIKSTMLRSTEYLNKFVKESDEKAYTLKDNFYIGMPPTEQQHIDQLVSHGVKTIVHIGKDKAVSKSKVRHKDSFEEYFYYSVYKKKTNEYDYDSVLKILGVLYKKTMVENKKTYLHATKNVDPIVLILAAGLSSAIANNDFYRSLLKITKQNSNYQFSTDLLIPDLYKCLQIFKQNLNKDKHYNLKFDSKPTDNYIEVVDKQDKKVQKKLSLLNTRCDKNKELFKKKEYKPTRITDSCYVVKKSETNLNKYFDLFEKEPSLVTSDIDLAQKYQNCIYADFYGLDVNKHSDNLKYIVNNFKDLENFLVIGDTHDFNTQVFLIIILSRKTKNIQEILKTLTDITGKKPDSQLMGLILFFLTLN